MSAEDDSRAPRRTFSELELMEAAGSQINASGHGKKAASASASASASGQASGAPQADLARMTSAMDVLRPEAHVSFADMASWSPEKRARLVEEMTPEQVPAYVREARRAGFVEEPTSLTFRNVFFKKQGTLLLNGVSGAFKPGLTTAVIGEGSTHLFDVLSGAQSGPGVSGEILVNGQPPGDDFRRRVGYVPKEDVHMPTLTVFETLMFSAKLRTPPSMPDELVEMRVLLVMKMLGLLHVRDTVVGNQTLRGVSGGEKRRVSIAVEAVAGHSVILADLPTNGLDSDSALRLCKLTAGIAASGNSSVFSLVQPSPAILETFDILILLSRGTCIYTGPPSRAEEYFKSHGFFRPPEKASSDFLEELAKSPQRFYFAVPPSTVRISEDERAKLEKRGREREAARRKRERLLLKQQQEEDENKDDNDDDEEKTMKGDMNDDSEVQEEEEEEEDEEEKEAEREGSIHLPESRYRESVRGDRDSEYSERSMAHRNAWQDLVIAYRESSMYRSVGEALWREQEPVYDDRLQKEEKKKRRRQDKSKKGKVRPSSSSSAQHHMGARGSAGGNSDDEEELHGEFTSTLWEDSVACLDRQVRVTLRDKTVFLGSIMRAIVVGLLVTGTTFFDLGGSQTDAQARPGLLFYCLTYAGMSPMQIIPQLVADRSVFYAQTKHAKYHRPVAYLLAVLIVQAGLAALELIIFGASVYGMAGLKGGLFSPEFGFFFAVILVTSLTTRSFCIFAAFAFPNVTMAQAIAPVLLVLQTITNGFLVPRSDIPSGWVWVHFLSLFTWSFKAVTINELKGLELDICDPQTQVCRFASGDDVLDFYALDESPTDKWVLFGISVALYAAYTLFAMFALLRIDHSAQITVVAYVNEDHVLKKELRVVQPGPAPGFEAIAEGDEDADEDGDEDGDGADHRIGVKAKNKAGYIEFSGLSYTVQVPADPKEPGGRAPMCGTKDKMLLSDITGFVTPGRMTALMGASGAGKSTLLDVLAGKKTGGKIGGKLLVNGKPPDKKTLSRIAAYVEQTDSHDETTTVREAVLFSAQLRLAGLEQSEIEARVQDTLERLELDDVADHIIGSTEAGGLDPSLRKKVTIAVELIADPSVLLLDEPTTGLPSQAAVDVMTAVRRLANDISVVATVHQPSEEIVRKFDWMLLLQKGGTVVYFGPVDEITSYFEGEGLGVCPPGKNVADFALEMVSASVNHERDPAEVFYESKQGKLVRGLVEEGLVPDKTEFEEFESQYAASWFQQVGLLTHRYLRASVRDPTFTVVRLVSALFMGFVIGTLYFDLDDSQISSNSRVSIMFLSLLYVFFSAAAVQPALIAQRATVFREKTSNMYSSSAHFLGRTLADVPWTLLQALLYGTLIYWLAGLSNPGQGGRYGLFMLNLVVTVQLAFAVAEFVAALVPNAEAANALTTVLLTLSMLFTGFLVPKSGIPAFWTSLYYANLLRYALFFFIANELEGQTFTCAAEEMFQGPAGMRCPIETGEEVMSQFSVDADNLWGYFAVSVGTMLGLRFFTYLALRFVNHIKR